MNPLAGLIAPALAVLPVALSGSTDPAGGRQPPVEVVQPAELTPGVFAAPELAGEGQGAWFNQLEIQTI